MSRITSRDFRLAIVGWPVARSLSPELWEGMARRRGLMVEYGRVEIRPDDETGWDALWSSELDAFNVTAPWKERAVRGCRTLDPAARAIEAVNTVIRGKEAWLGQSTDGYGFVRSLLAIEEPLRGRRMAVLGTGGAGRAVARATAESGAAVTLVSRRPNRTPKGCEGCTVIGYSELTETGPYDIVTNATPLGRDVGDPLPPVPDGIWGPDVLAVDLNYVPLVTAFLKTAHAAGARTLNGIGMLIHQACLGAALVIDGDPSAAESYEEDFWAVAREVASHVEPGMDRREVPR